ncbi:Hypothetical protein GSB_155573 [Giardia duodenalis]|uniref:Uncharacterized protein n=1 Tax=Giardia intestinalis TaxID=5741 RepID=V6TM13_GIAIN|nr:Hypothetical protein GSB_155573 [Giardia intestinalis]
MEKSEGASISRASARNAYSDSNSYYWPALLTTHLRLYCPHFTHVVKGSAASHKSSTACRLA